VNGGSRPLKIAMVGSRGMAVPYSGVETSVTELSARLAARGHDVHVFTRSRYRTDIAPNHRGVNVRFRPSINTKHLDTITHLFTSLTPTLFEDFDVVHFHALGPSLFSPLPRVFGKKTVATVQGLDWQRKKWNRFAKSVLQLGEWTSAKGPNATTVVSHVLERYYGSRYGVRAHYIPNGVNRAEPTAANHIKRWGLEKNGYVLFLARLTQEKNPHLLLDAWSKIESDIPLVLAGDNPYAPEYVASLHKQAEGRNVVFTGFQTGATWEELFSNAYLYVLCSDIEGQPISLLEAMSYGCCPLVSDIPENAEVVADGRGFTFRAGDVDDLAATIARLLASRDVVDAAAVKARAHVRAEHDWERIADATLAVYRSVLG
jgi:glycosyltransferase involved in cell wall biosynthesis